MQSLLQNLPMESQSMQYAPADPVQSGIAGAAGGIGIVDKLLDIFGV
jgi:hypothetical protein